MIILLGQVRQYDVSCTSIIVPGEEICESFVGEMAHAAHHSLFYRPGVRTAAQHFEIVVGLEQHHVASAELVANAGRNVAKIGSNGDFHALSTEGKPNRIGGVISLNGSMPRHAAPLFRWPDLRRLRVFIGHGIANAYVPLSMARDDYRLLSTAGLAVELHTYPANHRLHPDMLRDVNRWLISHCNTDPADL